MESSELVSLQPRSFWHQLEDIILGCFFILMIGLPIFDIISRVFKVYLIPDSLVLVQYLTLVIMMLGGAIAAREKKLLTLSSSSWLIPERFKSIVHIFTSAFAGAITLYLALASYQLVAINASVGGDHVCGIAAWIIEAILPIGFFLIFFRLIFHSASSWKSRFGTLILSACLFSGSALIHHPPSFLIILGFGLLLISILLGAPIFIALGGAALLLIWNSSVPIDSIPAETSQMVVSPTIPTIPLFTLTGYLLAEGGASKRLLRVFQSLFGSFRGGSAIVTALACAFFTALTGGSGVTILALGGLLMPILLAEKYSERDSLGLLTSAGSLGMLFPPSLPVILYGIVSHTPINQLFLGGLIPGVLLLILTMWWGIHKGSKLEVQRHTFQWSETFAAINDAKFELFLPFLIFIFLFVIKTTLVESAALTALYTFLIELLIYRNLKFNQHLFRVIAECGILVGGVLLILGVSLGFTNYMVAARIPNHLVHWVQSSIHSTWLFLIILNILLIIVGSLLEIFAAIVVVVPLLVPLGAAFHINPVHLGIIFLANMELGFLAPPLGLNLFLSSYRFKKPMSEVYQSVLPMYIILHIMVLLITFVPFLTLALPHWIR
jgi:tripartite ATP-independent transporter DctM subunit